MVEIKKYWCSYCGMYFTMRWEDFEKHLQKCEVDCVNKRYGDNDGHPAPLK